MLEKYKEIFYRELFGFGTAVLDTCMDARLEALGFRDELVQHHQTRCTASLLTPSTQASLQQLQWIRPWVFFAWRTERESAHWAFGRDGRCPVPRVRFAGSAASSERWWTPWSGAVA